MICVMAEKATAANKMILALSGKEGQRRFERDGEEVLVTWASGHVLEYAPPHLQVEPEVAWRYRLWDLGLLPWDVSRFCWKRRRISNRTANDAWRRLKADLTEADEIVIATDDDPSGEGSLLAWEVLDEMGLSDSHRLITRMRFADEEIPSLVTAFEERDTLIDSESDPDCRRAVYRCRWDFMSMQLTRAATRIAGGTDSICRVGRLKSAMVTLVGDQEEARKGWVKRPVYQARYKDVTGCVYKDEEAPYFAEASQVDLSAFPDDVAVVDRVRRIGTPPPALPDLMDIAAVFAKKGVAADDFLQCYQEMYEAGYLSYPRTEDKRLTVEQHAALAEARVAIARAAGVPSNLLTHTEPRKKHIGQGLAHGAIRPGAKVPDSAADLDRFGPFAAEIWREVALRSLRIFAEDYVYEQTEAHIRSMPSYKGSTKRPLRPGWRDVLDDGNGADQPQPGGPASAYVHEHVDRRPEEPSVDWIRTKLRKHDVGTASTRVKTLADICQQDDMDRPRARRRQLMAQSDTGKLSLTELGNTVYKVSAGTRIADLATTEHVQASMREAARGERGLGAAEAEMAEIVAHDIARMRENARAMGIEVPERRAPERVGGVFEGVLADVPATVLGHKITPEEAEALFAGREVRLEGLVSTDKVTGATRTYSAPAKLAKNERGRLYVAVDRSSWGVPDSFSGRALTQEEKKALEEGRKVYLTGLVSQKGKTYAGEVRFTDGRICFCDKGEGDGVWRSFSGHTFTEQERERLAAGEVLEQVALKRSRDGAPYTADIAWDPEAKKVVFTSERSRPDRPTRFSGHTFTDDEAEALLSGKTVFVEGLRRKDGTLYDRKLLWDAENKKVEFAPRKAGGAKKSAKKGAGGAKRPRKAR